MPTYFGDYIPLKRFVYLNGVLQSTATVASFRTSRSTTPPVTLSRKRPVGDEFSVFSQGTSRAGTRSSISDEISSNRYIEYQGAYRREFQKNVGAFKGVGMGDLMSFTDSSLATRSVNKARQKARANGVNLAMMLAEYKQTASLFAQSSKVLYLIGKTLRFKKAMFGRRLTTKDAADAHLAAVYGAQPLIHDVLDSYDAMQNAAYRDPGVVESRSGARHKYQDSSTGISYGHTWYQRRELKVLSTTKILVEMDNTLLLSTLGGTGFTNPISLAYELTPFSFVLDWWCNFGDFLGSLDNCIFMKRIRQQTTTRTTAEVVTSCGGTATYKYVGYSRGTVTDPGLIDRVYYKPSLSRQHVANGVALVRSLLGRSSISHHI